MTFAAAVQDVRPAGGAAFREVLIASVLGAALAAALMLVVWVHRSGRTTLVQRAADACGRRLELPGWVALPTLFTTVSLLTALFGMYWDISLHIGQGRDAGPLANPAHYFILFGLFGIFAGGVLAISLPVHDRPGPAAVRVTEGWYAPVGGLMLAGAGLYALIGFPLDDVWHRLFGQDVTLWGPTHLMLIGGAGLSIVGLLLLEQEGRSQHADALVDHGRLATFLRRGASMGGLLIGLSVFQGEFDFGVPQFRLVLQPVLLTAAAGVAMVAARLWMGRGGALFSSAFYLVVHSIIAVIVGPVLGSVTPRLPLYVGSALVVEVVALFLAKRPLLFGAAAGVGIATVGLLSELGWSQLVLRLPWGADVLREAVLTSIPTGIAAGTIGALLALGLDGRLGTVRRARPAFAASLLVIAAVIANGLVITVPKADVTVRLTEAGTRDGVRYATVDATIPEGVVDDPSWVQVTSWQGGGLVVAPLSRTPQGTWSSTTPVPVSGPDWKTLLRVHDGRALSALPIYLPADPAIEAEEVPAEASATRPLVEEITILQRERKLDVPGWLFGAASLVVLACTLVLVLSLAWGVARVSRATATPVETSLPTSPRTPQGVR